MSRLALKPTEVANFGDIGLPETMFARTKLCLEYNTACWEWFCTYRLSGKKAEVKAIFKKLEERHQMSRTMMLPPCLLKPYTDTWEAIKAIEIITAPFKDMKEPKRRIQEQHALATLYERIREGMESTKPEVQRQAARKYQNKLKGSDKRTIREYMYESLRLIDKIVQEARERHMKAIESHYQIRLVNAIATYDETIIASEIKEALPVADDFENVREALDAAAVILRTMAEYRDEFSDWAPPSKERLKKIREHKLEVREEDAKEAARKAEIEKKEAESKQLKLPPIAPASETPPQTSDEQQKAGKKEEQYSFNPKSKIIQRVGNEETIGEFYERQINNLQEKIKKLEYENDAASGQMRFLYANLTEERKAMIRTAYDFELPPEENDNDEDEDVNEDEDEIDVKVKKGFRVSELREKDKKSFEKRSLTMLHTTLELHQRKVKALMEKSKRLGGTIVLYDEYGNTFINDVNLTKKIVNPRDIKPKKKKKFEGKRKSRPNSPNGGDWDPETAHKKDRSEEPFPEQYLRDAAILHRELAFTNPIGLAASLRYAADLCMRSRDFGAALGLYEKVVEIRRKKMGEHDPEVAQSVEYLGEIHSQMGKFEKALLLQEEALNMRLNIFGNTHVDVAQNLRSIATLQAMHGKFDEAVTLYTRALNILLKNFHKTHPQVEMVKVQLQMARKQKKEESKRLLNEREGEKIDKNLFKEVELPGDEDEDESD